MSTFERFHGHEQVVFGQDEATGLRAIIAIHSTALGPALGGTRFHAYPDDDAALTDVLGDPDDDIGGRAAARAAATGSDEELMVVLKEECEANPDMDMAGMFQDEDEAK